MGIGYWPLFKISFSFELIDQTIGPNNGLSWGRKEKVSWFWTCSTHCIPNYLLSHSTFLNLWSFVFRNLHEILQNINFLNCNIEHLKMVRSEVILASDSHVSTIKSKNHIVFIEWIYITGFNFWLWLWLIGISSEMTSFTVFRCKLPTKKRHKGLPTTVILRHSVKYSFSSNDDVVSIVSIFRKSMVGRLDGLRWRSQVFENTFPRNSVV